MAGFDRRRSDAPGIRLISPAAAAANPAAART